MDQIQPALFTLDPPYPTFVRLILTNYSPNSLYHFLYWSALFSLLVSLIFYIGQPYFLYWSALLPSSAQAPAPAGMS